MSAAVASHAQPGPAPTRVQVPNLPAHPPSTPRARTKAANSPDLPPTPSPPRSKNAAQLKGQTRFEKEQAATGGKSSADHPGDPKVIGPWRIGKTIGKGASGRVKIAKHNKTGQFAAIKIIPKHVLLMASRTSIADAAGKHDKAIMGIEREIVIMKLIDHPNIMSLFDVWETSKELFLVLEYVEGGELFDYLVSQGRLHPDEASRYFRQIIAGVDYCHRFNICHRDLKPENLLLDADRNIKIADFGMAALEPSGRLLETSCGSPHYASPEIVMGLSYHGAASDIWSCGVILYALLTGRLPFDDENIRMLLQKVKNGRFTIPSDLPADARDLIARMLVVHPERRISMPEIMIHPFFQRRHATDSGRSIRSLDPPKLDLVDRPVRYEWEIDRDILRNLRTLWNGTSDRQMVRALLSPEKNMEKAFYFLLQQYRNKNLENYNADAESPNPGSVSTFSDQQNPGADVPVPHDLPGLRTYHGHGGPKSALPMLDGSAMAADGHVTRRDKSRDPERRKERERRRRERDLQKEQEGAGESRKVSRRASATSSAVSRDSERKPAARSATTAGDGRTATRPAPAAPGKSPQTPSRRSVLGPRPIAQTPTGAVGSPRPRAPGVENNPPAGELDHKSTVSLVQKRESAGVTGPMTPPHPLGHVKGIAAERVLPQITVQIPTPQNDGTQVTSPITSPSPSPLVTSVPVEMLANANAASPQPTTANVVVPATPSPSPRVGEHVNTTPSSPPLGNIFVPQVQDAALQKFFHDIAVQLQLIGGASPRSSLVIDTPPFLPGAIQDGQLTAASAAAAAAVIAQGSHAGAAPPLSAGSTADNTPIVTPLLDAPAEYTGVMNKENYPGTKASAGGHGGPMSPMSPAEPTVKRPLPLRALTEQGAVTRMSLEQQRDGDRREVAKRRSYVEPSMQKAQKLHDVSELPDVQPRRYSTQKVEGTRVVAKPESKRKPKPAPLDLSPRVMQPSQLLSPNATPHLNGASGFSHSVSGGSVPSSPLTIGPSSDGKQSWFSNLFSWKPAMFTLISADDCSSSRAECIKLLESFGAVVVLEDADGWGVLKCKVDEIRDVSGIIISKSVRFRIEFLPHSAHYTATPRIAHERFASGISSANATHSPRPPSSSPGPGGVSGARTAPSSPVPRGRVTSGVLASSGPYKPDGPPASGGIGASGASTTSMTMIQEKGALSAFKAVYGRIRAEWRLDSLKSPAIGSDAHGTKLLKTPGASPLPSPAIEQGQWA